MLNPRAVLDTWCPTSPFQPNPRLFRRSHPYRTPHGAHCTFSPNHGPSERHPHAPLQALLCTALTTPTTRDIVDPPLHSMTSGPRLLHFARWRLGGSTMAFSTQSANSLWRRPTQLTYLPAMRLTCTFHHPSPPPTSQFQPSVDFFQSASGPPRQLFAISCGTRMDIPGLDSVLQQMSSHSIHPPQFPCNTLLPVSGYEARPISLH